MYVRQDDISIVCKIERYNFYTRFQEELLRYIILNVEQIKRNDKHFQTHIFVNIRFNLH